MTFTPHPKAGPKAKKPGAMKTKPKPKTALEVGTAAHAAMLDDAEPAAAIAAAKAPKPAKAPKVAKPLKVKARGDKITMQGAPTKTDLIIAMLKKPGGASSKEMEAATGWKPHSVRGLLGTLRSKGTLIKAEKFAKGEPTVYSIDATPAPEAPPAPSTDEVI